MKKNKIVRVAILEDHQGNIDGYKYRLGGESRIEVVATACYADELIPMLETHPADLLILDIRVPISPANSNAYPLLYFLSLLEKKYPNLDVLIITMLTDIFLIDTIMEAGVSGYIYKGDNESIQKLARIILDIANGGIYLRDEIYDRIRAAKSKSGPPLSTSQVKILSLCAAYPDKKSNEIANMLGVASSTVRNQLSNTYFRLGVRTRQAAIAKVQQLGFLPNNNPDQDL